MQKSLIVLYGPTAVGKSDYALGLAHDFPVEIINCDVGQFYLPLSIGTAKPDWKNERTRHHFFDVLKDPIDYTVVEYKNAVLHLCTEIWNRGATPVLVGGSGFYIKSLFFPPLAKEGEQEHQDPNKYKSYQTSDLYEQLLKQDPQRASQIHPHDRYRIERALFLKEHSCNSLVSLQPSYQELGFPYLLMCLTRERSMLYNRINQRTSQMMQAGWIEETQALIGTAWEPFLRRKKLIGYDDIFSYLEGSLCKEALVKTIAQKTRHYAKRQMTFWRMLERSLQPHCHQPSKVITVDITDDTKAYPVYKKVVSQFLDSL